LTDVKNIELRDSPYIIN